MYTLKHRRRIFLSERFETRIYIAYTAQWQLWARAASQSQGRIARAFSSKSLVNTMDMTAAIQYILTAAQSLGSQVYYTNSRMTILGLAGVLFCENEQA